MISLGSSLGGISWICEELHLGSYCLQRTIVDGVNLFFLCAFYLFLIIAIIGKCSTRSSRKDWVLVVVSLCCALCSIGCFSVGLWNLMAKNDEFNHMSWLVYFVRGMVWISFTVSLLSQWSKWISLLNSFWWAFSFVLISILNVQILLRTHGIEILDIVPWSIIFLLFLCALRNLIHFPKRQIELDQASFLGRLTFSWINILEDEAKFAYKKFVHAWDSLLRETNSNSTRNMVLWAIAKVYLKENIFIGICAFLRTISVVVSPLILYAFVNYANGNERNLDEGLSIVGCLLVTKLVESLSQRHWFFDSRSLGRRRHSTGEIVKYIAVDAYRMGEFPWWFHSSWSFVLQLFLAIGILLWVVGLGALIGLVPLPICGLLNVPFANMLQKCQTQFMIAQDERLRSTSKILNKKFKNLIESLRENEFKWLAETQFAKAYGTLLYWMSPTIISSVFFLGCIIFGSAPLNASTIFTVLASLRSMGDPVRMIPEALSSLVQVKVSFNRLNAFLLDDELKNDELFRIPSQKSDRSVKIQSGNFSWDPEIMIPTTDMNLEIRCGQKVAVCGPVGAGKSSLLYAVLGEIPKISGTVNAFGSIAYVSQTSWIQGGTIRDNILYGKPMDKTKYEKAIKACALDRDINTFNHGDLTEIGQRGLNMSGGQKQRIQLARAVYKDADIYLLDDPFTAVDAHTAAILFNKTVILVTHKVEFLSEVDKILVMKDGQITQSGSYEELLTAGTAFEQLVNAHRDVITGLGPSNDEIQEETQKLDTVQPEMSQGSSFTKENSEGEIAVNGLPGVQLTEEEETEINDVGWKPFWDYIIVSKGLPLLFLGIVTQSGFVALQAAATYWLALGIQIPKITSGILIGVYTANSTLSAVFVYLRSFFAAHPGLPDLPMLSLRLPCYSSTQPLLGGF
ncbi:hypothetical protein RGQ29_021258 [Quercus rubra]|uniref:ABC-type xenobiotic transporter n=1 Tax=Quercus rubra TaxID=3512 RepID=A0AAN7FFV4_QUERU|nr:hypothetical protein RGQ29_021258 [Quercus rubra]